MKNSQSKFSNKKSGRETSSHTGSSSGCCCGSKLSEEIDEVDIIEENEK
ncbi:MAG: hypothetical protein IJ864_01535 [Alphaproteobacteria bacterium]|nr:hypothetical protein [Alphaproteobacteria bacterium]